MFTLWRLLPVRRLLLRQLPQLLAALLIAEMFYKFGSFLLEAIAFLATWFILDALGEVVAVRRSRRRHDEVGDRLQAESSSDNA